MGCGCGLCPRISLCGPGLESRVDGFGVWLGFDLCWGFFLCWDRFEIIPVISSNVEYVPVALFGHL